MIKIGKLFKKVVICSWKKTKIYFKNSFHAQDADKTDANPIEQLFLKNYSDGKARDTLFKRDDFRYFKIQIGICKSNRSQFMRTFKAIYKRLSSQYLK